MHFLCQCSNPDAVGFRVSRPGDKYSFSMAIRLKDVAQHLQLSVSTVSAALQNREDISEATRIRVVEAVEQLGYHPNSLARGLITRKTFVLGVIVPDLSRSFFAEVLKGIDSITSPAGYNLLVCNTEENAKREKEILNMLLSNQVDGVLLASAHDPNDADWPSAKSGHCGIRHAQRTSGPLERW